MMLKWDHGVPVSMTYDDVYYTKENGLAETEHTFIEGNRLKERFEKTTNFTIGETGFGTGLNFLATWQYFTKYASKDATLHFVSVEKHPLAKKDLCQALASWEQLSKERRLLYDAYDEAQSTYTWQDGAHTINLTLLIEDAANVTWPTPVDAWFLDGFSPAKNPDMWNNTVFSQIAKASQQGTTLATFTAARKVRDGLINAGFTIEKASGFGRKRDMLVGIYGA